AQRALCRAGGVIEGRDTGSVVFPEAPVKLYLVAHAGVRAHRRAQERAAPTRHVGEALETRDERDATVNPFEPPSGAVVIDTSALDASSTLAAALDAVGRRAPGVFS
ncbi:MAG: (d)CMP kinase, partial [Actinomycetota bacterium]